MVMRDVSALPKAHLHVHLEGAMRPITLAALAKHYGLAVPDIRGYDSFTTFADTYVAVSSVLVTPEDMRRLVFEVVEDCCPRRGVMDRAVHLRCHSPPALGPW